MDFTLVKLEHYFVYDTLQKYTLVVGNTITCFIKLAEPTRASRVIRNTM